jgi:hypothetical protein
MKYFLMFLAFFVGSAYAETVINYDDGSTYTLEAGQEIYIASEASTLFKRKIYNNKNIYFTAQAPWSKRDYVAQPTDGLEVGSHEWCLAYEPWHEGYTFGMQYWQRGCDTNGDGVYDENDAGWEG